ncbi:terminal nucleotidyltransferase 4B [Ipomoea triloba]|uniref:terminal nucleotidyltransferase 4B n=1 Tax=Ipomoea triloba TaxID=35885 RepID=UPI00125DC9C6|nr:terminal nucleotidyltransferase 4B [Ipomoea triloba]
MENQEVLYETLSPLFGDASAEQTPPASPPRSDNLEQYVVFRNEISLDSTQCPSPEAAAQDYFSLDADAEVDELKLSSLSTPSPASVPVPVKEPARTIEGNWFRANCSFRSPMLQLHKEILDFCDFLSPSQEEQAGRNAAVERVFNVIKYIWPKSKPEVFGSFRTGLYLPSSDVDVVILGSDIRSPQIGLHALSKALSQKGIAKKIQVIAKARVPIIKFVEKESCISFDISFDVQNGPKAAEFITDAVSKWPPLRPLCLILKIFLQQRELNEVYTGGIGSYGLLVMLIAMLRNHRDFQASREQNLGVLLVSFFDLYGRKLNTSDVGLSCNGEGTFFRKITKGFLSKGKPYLISIEDPQTPENDVGKSSFNYFQVKSAFSMAFTTLTNANAILELGPSRSILGMIIRPDEVLLVRKGGSDGDTTFDSLLPGAGEPLPHSDTQDIYYNWQLNDEDEELLPRGNGIVEDMTPPSSSKKRKKSKEKQSSKKKMKDDGHTSSRSRKEKSSKKRRWKHEGSSPHYAK